MENRRIEDSENRRMKKATFPRFPDFVLLLALFSLMLAGCANYKFEQKFNPLLVKDQSLNEKYSNFEDGLPNDKHYSQNVVFLKSTVDTKLDILNNLKTITPTKDYLDVYNAFVEELTTSSDYLKKEAEWFEKNTEYALWLAQSLYKGGFRHQESGPELSKAKQAVLQIQQDLTAQAEKCNAAQEKLNQLVLSKRLLPKYTSVKFTKFHKDTVGFRLR